MGEERTAPSRREAVQPPHDWSDPGALPALLAAEYLGLAPATLETMRSRGGGPPFVKLGRRVVYHREDLDAWMDERTRADTSE
ncbi:MAG: helix-turn-helix domain-containing protein [Acidobacteriota bacterium]